jgi:hypothetical protein
VLRDANDKELRRQSISAFQRIQVSDSNSSDFIDIKTPDLDKALAEFTVTKIREGVATLMQGNCDRKGTS